MSHLRTPPKTIILTPNKMINLTLYKLESIIVLTTQDPPLKERLTVEWKVVERPSLRLPYSKEYIKNCRKGCIDKNAEDYLNEFFHENEIIEASLLIRKLFPGCLNRIEKCDFPVTIPQDLDEMINSYHDIDHKIDEIELLDFINAGELAKYWGQWQIDIIGKVRKRELVV